jgi:hypothetical protein
MDPIKAAYSFAKKIFVFGGVFGIITAAVFAMYTSVWDPTGWDGAAVFRTVIILWGLGFMFPCFTVSMRLMLSSFEMSHKAVDNSEKIGNSIEKVVEKAEPSIDRVAEVADKIEPTVENVIEIVSGVKDMVGDISTIAHKIRGATESLNGSLDVAKINENLSRAVSSLETLAGVFKPKKGKKSGGIAPLSLGALGEGVRK